VRCDQIGVQILVEKVHRQGIVPLIDDVPQDGVAAVVVVVVVIAVVVVACDYHVVRMIAW